ncbi:hypothetical protein VTN00DRAFT_5055 [Thermoascus crustaceus]|uniref:mitochondrial 54S ribosomal bL33m domain-containing protein n=1 Tax=Thermoascus crustaceus TaxID=5088 RepID=UPI003742F980
MELLVRSSDDSEAACKSPSPELRAVFFLPFRLSGRRPPPTDQRNETNLRGEASHCVSTAQRIHTSVKMAKKAKSRTVAVRLISMAMTGYYRTMVRPRTHRPLSMLKYDPVVKKKVLFLEATKGGRAK